VTSTWFLQFSRPSFAGGLFVLFDPSQKNLEAVSPHDGEIIQREFDVFLFLLWRGGFSRALDLQIKCRKQGMADDVIWRPRWVAGDNPFPVEGTEPPDLEPFGAVVPPPEGVKTLPLDIVFTLPRGSWRGQPEPFHE